MNPGPMWGADVDALDRVGRQLEQSAAALRHKAERLSSELHAAPWHGRSADRFRQDFSAVHVRSIHSAAQFIDDAKEVLRRNADEQRVASGLGPRNESWWNQIVGASQTLLTELKSWQQHLSPWEATAISIEGLVLGGLPGLVVAMSVSTGANPFEVVKQLGISARDVITGENMSPRMKAFVNLCKSVPKVGMVTAGMTVLIHAGAAGLDVIQHGWNDRTRARLRDSGYEGAEFAFGDVVRIGKLAWHEGEAIIDIAQHGPTASAMTHFYRANTEALDVGVGLLTNRKPAQIAVDVHDVIFGSNWNSSFDSWTTPSGILDHVESQVNRASNGKP